MHALRIARLGQGLARPPVLLSALAPDSHLATAYDMPATNDMEKGQHAHIVALVIHGGAGGTTTPDMPADLLEAYRNRLRSILTTTYAAEHASSLDAVCHAVSQLEDSPLFNAGKGAVFDLAGHTVCECSLMTTQPHLNSNTVAVTGVERTKNPIKLARVLMEKNKELGGHAFYSGGRPSRPGGSMEPSRWARGTTGPSAGGTSTSADLARSSRAMVRKSCVSMRLATRICQLMGRCGGEDGGARGSGGFR